MTKPSSRAERFIGLDEPDWSPAAQIEDARQRLLDLERKVVEQVEQYIDGSAASATADQEADANPRQSRRSPNFKKFQSAYPFNEGIAVEPAEQEFDKLSIEDRLKAIRFASSIDPRWNTANLWTLRFGSGSANSMRPSGFMTKRGRRKRPRPRS
jgi:hypothetical protein